jgi:hypothetical protein
VGYADIPGHHFDWDREFNNFSMNNCKGGRGLAAMGAAIHRIFHESSVRQKLAENHSSSLFVAENSGHPATRS